MKRSATASWKGGLKDGQGSFGVASGVIKDQKFGFRTRFEDEPGTNPEELIAAAHAGCFTMATTAALTKAGFSAERLDTKATLSLEQVEGNWTITAVHLDLKARIPGLAEAQFQEITAGAKAGCPVSRVLKADISLTAILEA